MAFNIDGSLERSLALLNKELKRLEDKANKAGLSTTDLNSFDKIIGKFISLKKAKDDLTIEQLRALTTLELKALQTFITSELTSRPDMKEES